MKSFGDFPELFLFIKMKKISGGQNQYGRWTGSECQPVCGSDWKICTFFKTAIPDIFETGREKERLESVAEHIYGCLILAIAINSEYKLNLDMYKVLKMLTLHELEEVLMGDLTIRANITKEQKTTKRKFSKIPGTKR